MKNLIIEFLKNQLFLPKKWPLRVGFIYMAKDEQLNAENCQKDTWYP